MESSQSFTISPELQEKYNQINHTINGKEFTKRIQMLLEKFIQKNIYIEYSPLVCTVTGIPGITYDRKGFYIVHADPKKYSPYSVKEIGFLPNELLILEYTNRALQKKLLDGIQKLEPGIQHTLMQFNGVFTNEPDTLDDGTLYVTFDRNGVNTLTAHTTYTARRIMF